MRVSRVFRRRNLALLALFILLVSAVYGFAASNTVDESGAGDGSNVISGYDITNVTYNLQAANPNLIDTVQFDVAPSAGAADATEVQAQLVNAGAWFSCTNTAGNTWSCNVGGNVSALSASQLRVVAVQ